MSKILVLAEKPSVGKDIARVLNCHKKINGALEGNQYIVTWALGHLVTLADPENYDQNYKSWKIEDLPIMPKNMKLVVIKKTNKQYQSVKAQMLRKDVSQIVIATDAGREGELVARWIIQKAGVQKPLKRLWISSVTDKAIRDGFAHLKDAKAYEPLFYSAYSRSVADWLVGINATRALTCKYNAQLACGRVQTPTLAMIALQEDKIRHFKPQDFYGIQVKTSDIHWTWHGLKNETYLFDEKQIDQIIQDNENQSFQVSDVTKTSKKKYSPQLYDLTELQRDANKIYGYSAKETLSIMQSLYEYHKLLTYPRTDSRYLTDDIVPTLKERLEASLGGNHDQVIQKILSQSIKKQAHFVNNSKVSDHHAIIPTEQTAYLGELNESELKIYELVLKRFLAVLLPPYEYEQTTLTAHLGHETFIAKGKREKVKGWKEVYDMQDDEQLLPIVQVGDKLEIVDIIKTNGQTQPPAYFNEATLLSAMENPVRFMNHSNQKLNQTLIQTGGLGTVATRADIIEKLFNTFLIEKHGQDIHVTHKGRQLLSLVPEDLRSPELTARWELQLSKIAQRKLHSQEFIKEIRQYTVRIIDEIEKSDGQFKHDNMTHKKCPECGEPLLEVNGKKGKMLVCSSRECHYRETLSVITNARCPQCHKKLELVGKGDKQMFVCKTCGYRIGMKAFQKEREERKQTAGKSDVKKYLQKQKKETQMSVDDSPFAALLNLKDQLK
ncbi:MAG: DNA topoisomerase III [Longibaculum muris]|uniref:DNA topoisomerase 3 n=1 Tax=Longibaculum muris TaxID=1796628 RepID=A0A4R3Z764_9FIRM|nr:DNA topoisomerase III [Longibaculum muris]KXU50702.1 DNA topoisomerase [Candidatus Stoquefichus sp. KLE1796]MBS5368538.1 DNA topoisomerase III [Coprobacillus cateniformis]MCR1887362.1 DNA topoisomerase III [Longibaculum muris]MED9812257.1 DNA topoisomerase III [Longibaculum muris]TCW02063.1 DNA topoisomerase-3 [Longibaculum muris]